MTDSTAATVRHGRRSALALLFLGRALSQVGTSLQGIAQSLTLLAVPGGERLIGLVAVLPTTAALLLSGVGGALADRFSARAVLLGTQPALAVIALLMGLAAHGGGLGAAGLFVGVLTLNLVAALGTAAWQVLISAGTGQPGVRSGTTLNTVALDAGLIVGSLLAAPTIAALSTSGAFMLNAVSYLVPTTILLSLGAGRSDRTRVTPGERVTVRQVISRLRRGRQLPAVIAVATAAALAGTSLPTLLLLFVHQEHATSAAVYGLLLGTMSAGSLAAAVLTWRWTSSPRSVHIEALLLGVLILAVAAVPGVRGAVPLLFVVGFLFLTLRVGVMTLVQLQAPAHGRATTVALLSLVLAGAQIVGTTSFSALASVVGARRTIALVGLLLVIAVVAISVATGLSRQGGSVKAPPDAPKSSTQALIRPGVQQGAGQRRCVQDKLYDRQCDVDDSMSGAGRWSWSRR